MTNEQREAVVAMWARREADRIRREKRVLRGILWVACFVIVIAINYAMGGVIG